MTTGQLQAAQLSLESISRQPVLIEDANGKREALIPCSYAPAVRLKIVRLINWVKQQAKEYTEASKNAFHSFSNGEDSLPQSHPNHAECVKHMQEMDKQPVGDPPCILEWTEVENSGAPVDSLAELNTLGLLNLPA